MLTFTVETVSLLFLFGAELAYMYEYCSPEGLFSVYLHTGPIYLYWATTAVLALDILIMILARAHKFLRTAHNTATASRRICGLVWLYGMLYGAVYHAATEPGLDSLAPVSPLLHHAHPYTIHSQVYTRLWRIPASTGCCHLERA